MLINLLILILLIWAFLVGYSRGLVLQALYSLGIIISAIIAFLNYKELASKLTMWVPFSSATADSRLLFFDNNLLFQIDDAFYAGLAFMIIFVISYAVIRLLGLFRPHYTFATLRKNWKNYRRCSCTRSNLFRPTNGCYFTCACTHAHCSKPFECFRFGSLDG